MLGSPISHSKSPLLHAAAYRTLGLDWEFGAYEVTGATLAEFVSGCDASWRGLALTMPLKQDVFPLLDRIDRVAELTGAANTLCFDQGLRLGFNTDVAGIVRCLADAGVTALERVVVLGGGATARSALVAVGDLGASEVQVYLRDPAKGDDLVRLADRVGVSLRVAPLDTLDRADSADLVVSTVPGHAELAVAPSTALIDSALLFDVAYAPWPTNPAATWLAGGGRAISGLGMLIHQALIQVRIFVAGDPATPLPDEPAVLAAMRAAVA